MILIGLGSNLGRREENLANARAALDAHDVRVVECSSIHETPALMPEGAPPEWDIPYLNQVVVVDTRLDAKDLLYCLKHIEAELGRKSGAARWAPREIDLDILAYHTQILVTDALVIPHPHLDERRFVLAPMVEVAPEWRHPVLEKTARQLLAELR